MSEPYGTWWLRAGDQAARRITQGGLLIGRSPHCDLVVASEQVSRRQALVHLGAEGPRLLVFGRGAMAVSGHAVEAEHALATGDRIEVGALVLEVQRHDDAAPQAPAAAAVWVLEDRAGAFFGMSRSPFLVGGSLDDDLRVEGWPDGAAVLWSSPDGRLEVEASEPLAVDGEALPPGERRPLRRGSTVAHGDSWIRVLTGGAFGAGSTTGVREGRPLEITRAQLEFLPRGGRLHLTFGGEPRVLYLADRRCDLIAVLLQPPEPLAPGDFVDDALVSARVWGKRAATRINLNQLVHRVRKDLERAGVEGAVLERSEGGGATRLVLAPDATVELA